MKLTIVITHYNEPWGIVSPLFDSLMLQRGINWEDIEILVIQDGDHTCLIPRAEDRYPELPILTIVLPKGGVSKARNKGLYEAHGEYVMFCDCDDMMHNAFGLHLVFKAIDEKPDVITSKFIEESRYKDEYRLVNREKDVTFVHGKAFRRQYLLDKDIKFPEHLSKHEDGVFIFLAFQMTENTKTINTPFYLWVWNPSSVMRSIGVENAVLYTYPEVIAARECLTEEMLKRGLDVKTVVARTVMDSYYDFQKRFWNLPENASYRRKALKAFADYYRKYCKIYLSNTSGELAEAMMVARTLAYQNGLQVERMTLADFIKGLNGV